LISQRHERDSEQLVASPISRERIYGQRVK
jgi:hypothetical protein